MQGIRADGTFTKVKAGTVAIFSLDISLQKQRNNCDSTNQILSDCLAKHFNLEFGNGYNEHVAKVMNFTATMITGQKNIQDVTKCPIPCDKTQYTLIPAAEWSIETHRFEREKKPFAFVIFFVYHFNFLFFFRDPSVQYLLESGSNYSAFLAFNYFPKEHILEEEELPIYTGIKFISDVGGILGIFLGMSFWSLYLTFVAPLVYKLEKCVDSWLEPKSTQITR